MVKPEDLTNDQLLYNAVLWLVQNEYHEAATLLVECEYDGSGEDIYVHWNYDEVEWTREYIRVTLSAPHALQPIIGASDDTTRFEDTRHIVDPQEPNPLRSAIEQAFEAILRVSPVLVETHVQLIVESEGDWREHLRELAKSKGKVATNQGRQFDTSQRKPITVWNNLNFRSRSEVAIAKALDSQGVMYLPNCAARLGPPEHRHNKEPDFLICYEGKWGILEVDSPEFHPNRGSDDERDLQFKLYGVKEIQHFQWKECQEHPDAVVGKFLALLARA